MFYIVETSHQLELFNNRGYKEVFLEYIPYSWDIHPLATKVSLIYIRPLRAKKGYIFPIKHSEAFPLNKKSIYNTLLSFDLIHVRDKKSALQFIPLDNYNDLKLNTELYENKFPSLYTFYTQLYSNLEYINKFMPISKYYEYYENIYEEIKSSLIINKNNFSNNILPDVLSKLESTPIKTDTELLKHYFNIDKSYVYSRYNYKTLTTRPFNTFDGINFTGLKNKDGSRKCFIPNNDIFIELDISAYHPSMAAELIGYDFNGRDIHEYFSELYGVSYKESKSITFNMFYGGNYGKYKNLEFYQKLDKFVTNLWEQFNSQGYIEEETGGVRFYKNKLKDMYPNKLFNYLLQAKETAQNILVMKEIFSILGESKTKLILYNFDSFTFDFCKSEKYLLGEIIKIFDDKNLKYKLKSGKNLNFKN